MATEFQSVDDFLKHQSQERGSRGSFLDWKKDGRVLVWLHTRRLPIAIWQHRFPMLNVKEDKDSGEQTKRFYGKTVNCWEDESVLKKQNLRDRAGARDTPPRRCPICKMLEVVRGAVIKGDLNWCDNVFEFEGSTETDNDIVLHAGGLYGAFQGKLSDGEKADLKRKGIYLSDAWKENVKAKLSYIFCVVDDAHPEKGVQIATEPGLLGDKVKKVINDRIAGSEGDDGNLFVNPYVIELIHNKDQNIPFDKKYDARPMPRFKLTPEVEKLIRGEPPDLARQIEPFDGRTLRAVMEQYAVVDLPWDEIFSESPAVEEESPAPKPKKVVSAPKPAKVAPPPPPSSSADVDLIPCDQCKAPMKSDDTVCKACGAQYELEDTPPAPPKKSAKGKAPPAASSNEDDDQIPF